MGRLFDAFFMYPEGGSDELSIAGRQSVERHTMPATVLMPDLSGGRRNGRTHRPTLVSRAQCPGGKAINVMHSGSGSGIIGECSRCHTTVFWESRLKIWTV